MARKKIEIDLACMQDIINTEQTSFNGGIINFLDHCANIYNQQKNPDAPLYGQLLYMRIKNKELTCNFKAGAKNTTTTKIDENFTAEENHEFHQMIMRINKKANTNYGVEIHGQFAQLNNAPNNYCVSLANMRVYLLGLGVMHGINLLDTQPVTS